LLLSTKVEGTGSESTDDLVGKRLAHFTIQAKLGEGGMGVVYVARHPGGAVARVFSDRA
jgi:serine/threonine protein kinase